MIRAMQEEKNQAAAEGRQNITSSWEDGRREDVARACSSGAGAPARVADGIGFSRVILYM